MKKINTQLRKKTRYIGLKADPSIILMPTRLTCCNKEKCKLLAECKYSSNSESCRQHA